jgi:hypothetical protein
MYSLTMAGGRRNIQEEIINCFYMYDYTIIVNVGFKGKKSSFIALIEQYKDKSFESCEMLPIINSCTVTGFPKVTRFFQTSVTVRSTNLSVVYVLQFSADILHLE